MRQMIAFIATLFFAALGFSQWAEPGFAQSSFVNWENPHIHPIDITPAATPSLQ
jgi:hypothetical protein